MDVTRPTETTVHSLETPLQWRLTRHDAAAGTIIALVLCATFTMLSSGASLLVTFVPGLIFAWLGFGYLYRSQRELPDATSFLPVYVVTLANQFVHFAEEFVAGFANDFAVLYGGDPYDLDLFVVVNMAAYAIFAIAVVAVVTRRLGFLLVPALFFLVYGAVGNAIAHTWWSIMLGAYFPGLITAQLFWIVGPVALYVLAGQGNGRRLAGSLVVFAAVLGALLTVFADPANLNS